jgi:hypothetical protein
MRGRGQTFPNFSKDFQTFPRISKFFQGKSKLFQAFSKEMQRYSLVVSNEIKGLATKTGVFGFLEVPGANSPRVRLARAERPEAEALAEVRFQATMNSVFPEANVAGVSGQSGEERRDKEVKC